MNKSSKTILVLVLIIMFSLIFLFKNFFNSMSGYDDAKKFSANKFFVSQVCRRLIGQSQTDNVTYVCRDLTIYLFYDGNHTKQIFRFKEPISLSNLENVFDGFYLGKAFSTSLNCSESIDSHDNTIQFSISNCSYNIRSELQFEKLDENTVSVEKRSLFIDLNKTSKQDLIEIAKKIYGNIKESYYINLPAPDTCKVNITDNLNSINVSLCDDIFILDVNKYDNTVIVFEKIGQLIK